MQKCASLRVVTPGSRPGRMRAGRFVKEGRKLAEQRIKIANTQRKDYK
jgi:hypothetical protein